MYKKIIILTVIMLMSIAITVNPATDLSVNISIDYSTNKVTVSGSLTGVGAWVTFYSESPTTKLEYIGNAKVVNGEYEIKFGIQNPTQGGEYKLMIKAEGMATPKYATFVWDAVLSPPLIDNRKAFLIVINNNEFYSNMADEAALYKNAEKIYNFPSLWLSSNDEYIYFNSDGLKRFNILSNSVENLTDRDPYYIIVDGNNIFYADWDDGGKIYKFTLGGIAPILVCKDSAVRLEINGNYLEYKNAKDSGKPYKILKTSENAETGVIIE